MSYLTFVLAPMEKLGFLFVVWLLLCALVGTAAVSLHRRPAIWILLAMLLSPLAAFVLLRILGDADEGTALQEKEARLREQHPELKDPRLAALNEMNCPHCGAAVNPVTADGLHSPQQEP